MANDDTKAASKLVKSISDNATDDPMVQVSGDGEMAVVGDPNKAVDTKTKVGEYSLAFEIPCENAQQAPDGFIYDDRLKIARGTLTFASSRIKPAYRTKMVATITPLLNKIGIMTTDGYDVADTQASSIFQAVSEEMDSVIEIAHQTLGVDKELLQYADSISLINFFADLLDNEPNILKECVNFLA